MNAARRKERDSIVTALNDIRQRIDTIANEEWETSENIPESMEEKKSAADEAFTALEEAGGNIDDAISTLEGIE